MSECYINGDDVKKHKFDDPISADECNEGFEIKCKDIYGNLIKINGEDSIYYCVETIYGFYNSDKFQEPFNNIRFSDETRRKLEKLNNKYKLIKEKLDFNKLKSLLESKNLEEVKKLNFENYKIKDNLLIDLLSNNINTSLFHFINKEKPYTENMIIEIIKKLRNKNFNFNYFVGYNNINPLIIAIYKEYYDVAEYLINNIRGIDLNIESRKGTPLILAIKNKNTKLAKLLINKGADTNITNRHDLNALFYAVENNNNEIIDLLFEKNPNIDVNTYDDYGNSLFDAFDKNNFKVFEKLIDNGIYLDVKNKKDKTIFEKINYKINNSKTITNELKYLKKLIQNGLKYSKEYLDLLNNNLKRLDRTIDDERNYFNYPQNNYNELIENRNELNNLIENYKDNYIIYYNDFDSKTNQNFYGLTELMIQIINRKIKNLDYLGTLDKNYLNIKEKNNGFTVYDYLLNNYTEERFDIILPLLKQKILNKKILNNLYLKYCENYSNIYHTKYTEVLSKTLRENKDKDSINKLDIRIKQNEVFIELLKNDIDIDININGVPAFILFYLSIKEIYSGWNNYVYAKHSHVKINERYHSQIIEILNIFKNKEINLEFKIDKNKIDKNKIENNKMYLPEFSLTIIDFIYSSYETKEKYDKYKIMLKRDYSNEEYYKKLKNKMLELVIDRTKFKQYYLQYKMMKTRGNRQYNIKQANEIGETQYSIKYIEEYKKITKDII